MKSLQLLLATMTKTASSNLQTEPSFLTRLWRLLRRLLRRRRRRIRMKRKRRKMVEKRELRGTWKSQDDGDLGAADVDIMKLPRSVLLEKECGEICRVCLTDILVGDTIL
jgi:hypothetical protein